MVNVEFVFVAADKTLIQLCLSLQEGATVVDAINASGILSQYPQANSWAVGIFSKLVTHKTLLHSGDRIELYRPLQIDPKEMRRLRGLKK